LSSTIEFEVPYVARSPFTQVYFCNYPSTIEASDLTTGILYVNVVNPLANSAGTVPSAITMVVYIAGGSDIEFAMPGRQGQLSGYSPAPAILARREAIPLRKAKLRFEPQGGPFGDDQTSSGLNAVSMGRLRNVPVTSSLAHLSTMGERVLSLRMVIKRFGAGVVQGSSTSFLDALLGSWYLGYISLAFTFWTGSWRMFIDITAADFESATAPSNWKLVWNNTYSGPGIQDGEATMTIASWSNASVLEVPWYSPIAFRILGDYGITTLDGPALPTSLSSFAAGDDFCFGFQVGPPLITYLGVLPTPLY